MDKTCTRCQLSKPLDEFAFKSKKKGTLNARCKKCMSEVCSDLYKSSPTRKNEIKKRNKEMGIWHTLIIRRYKEMCGCQKCKGKFKYYVLELHHVHDKDEHIAVLMKRASWKTVKKEIRKCIVVCANCHREIHYGEVADEVLAQD